MNGLASICCDSPYKKYEDLLTRGVVWDEVAESWLVSRYSNAKEVLNNHSSFSHPFQSAAALAVCNEEPLRHRSLHEFVSGWADLGSPIGRQVKTRFFKELALEFDNRGGPSRIVERYLSGIRNGEPVEWVEQVARPMVLDCLYGVLSIEDCDKPKLAHSLRQLRSVMNGRKVKECDDESAEAISTLQEISETSGLASLLNETEVRYAVPLVGTAFRAGRDSTLGVVCGVANGMSQWYARGDKRRVHSTEKAVEELLRTETPVHAIGRRCTKKTLIGDRLVREGDRVLVLIGAANRDPRVFKAPNEVDLNRFPNPHLAFGNGVNYCLGAALARVILRTLIESLLTRFSSAQLVTNPTYNNVMPFMRSYKHMTIVFKR